MPNPSGRCAGRLIGRVAMAVSITLSACGLVFADGWQHVAAVQRVDKLPDGIELTAGRAKVRITLFHDGVARVRAAFDGNFPKDTSWAVIESPEPPQFKIDDTQAEVRLSSPSLHVVVKKSPLLVSFTDASGNTLLADVPSLPMAWNGSRIRNWKMLPPDENYYGLGDKTGPISRRNRSFINWNTDEFGFGESSDPIYKTLPFFIGLRKSTAYGVFFDNTWRSSFDFGKQVPDVYSFGATDGPIDYYLLYGSDAKQVLNRYAWLTGPTPLPPLWAFGYQQSRYSYGTEAELREIASRLRADHIPADALYLDIDYQKDNRPFTVDLAKFPNFSGMLSDLKKQHFHVVAITDLHIADLPSQGYIPFDSGVAGDHFLKNDDSSIYVGPVWPGPSVFPDFTRQSTREWWGELYKPFVADGVSGFWNDMNEPSVFAVANGTIPDDIQHRIDEIGFEKRTASHREIHNIYGMENSRATYEGLSKISPDQRPFVLTRATYAGGQRYAATWTGDDSSTWNHLRLTTPMLLNLGLSGFGLSGADVGGFIGTASPELLTKWMEIGAFQPIDRNHSEKGTGHKEPWVHGPEQEAIRRRYIEERYKLMPYLYSTAEEMSRTGVPMMRPLFLEFPNTASGGRPLDLDAGNEFMLGRSLLIAPSPYPEKLDEYRVVLPPSHWYDYWTGALVDKPNNKALQRGDQGVQFLPEIPTLGALPIFVREGTILPLQPLTQSTAERPEGPLTLRVYPGNECEGSLYQDDGGTLAYQRGGFLRIQFSCDQGPSSFKVHISSHEGTYRPWWKQLQIEVYGWTSSSAHVLVRGKVEAAVTVDPVHQRVSFTIPDDGHGSDLEVTSTR